MTGRPLFGKRDIWLLAGLLVLAGLAYAVTAPCGPGAAPARAQISVDGHVVQTVSLLEDGEVALEGNPRVRFAVRSGAVAFIESDCPDQICVRTGALSRTGQMAVCLPNRASLAVVGPGPDEWDAVAN